MFRYKLKELLPPWSIRIIKHLFTKLLKLFNADDANRFGDGFPSLVVDSFSVLEFFKWHKTRFFSWIVSESRLNELYPSQWNRAKQTRQRAHDAALFGSAIIRNDRPRTSSR